MFDAEAEDALGEAVFSGMTLPTPGMDTGWPLARALDTTGLLIADVGSGTMLLTPGMLTGIMLFGPTLLGRADGTGNEVGATLGTDVGTLVGTPAGIKLLGTKLAGTKPEGTLLGIKPL